MLCLTKVISYQKYLYCICQTK